MLQNLLRAPGDAQPLGDFDWGIGGDREDEENVGLV